MSRWLRVVIIASVVLLPLAHCATRSAVKEPIPSSSYPSSFRPLPQDRLPYFTSLAACEGVEVERLLENVAASAFQRGYDSTEFAGMLQSLQHLLTTSFDPPGSYAEETEQPFPVASDDIVYAWIDPTCDRCALTVELLRALQKEQGSAPSIVFRLLPGESEIARYTAAGLELVRERDADLFVPTLLETLVVLPGSTAVADQQLAPLIGAQTLASAPGFESAKMRVQQLRSKAGFTDYAPIIVYKGRMIRRDNTGSRVFDPFRDSETLKDTIRFVRLEDARIRGDQRCQH